MLPYSACAVWGFDSFRGAGTQLRTSFLRWKGGNCSSGRCVVYSESGWKRKIRMDWCNLYFPSSRGIKTARYTLALYIDRKTKQLKKSLLFDDVNALISWIICLWMKIRKLWSNFIVKWEQCWKKSTIPWYTEKILSDRIPYWYRILIRLYDTRVSYIPTPGSHTCWHPGVVHPDTRVW